MKLSLNWIKEYANIDVDDEKILELIGSRIGEVENIEHLGGKYKDIVIGEIVEANDHPDADKLGVYKVDIGKKKVQVCAGDKNLRTGDKVGYIPPGAVVPSTANSAEPVVIDTREMRGKKSEGMLGSGYELSLNENKDGVLKLDTDYAPGTPLAEEYGLDDIVFEIENKTLTHRPDCFGIIGIAREVSAIQGLPFQSPEWLVNTSSLKGGKGLELSVHVKEPRLNPRYMAVALSGVKLSDSPIEIQTYLTRLGIKPVNNVVDITNYLMLLTGQPLHAFDYDKVAKLSGKPASIVVRKPNKDETIKLLDGRTIKPWEEATLICTDKVPIALGGVMGGANTEVDNKTKNIIIESANFDMYNIRKTSMKHGIFTEAVTRFSRGQSPDQCKPVLFNAIEMIQKYAGAELASSVEDIYSNPSKSVQVETTLDFISQRLGKLQEMENVVLTLTNAEIDTEVIDDGLIKATPPYWRQDINIAEDIVEEIGRLNGFDNLGATLPLRSIKPTDLRDIDELKVSARSILTASGGNELLTYNFVSKSLMQETGQDTGQAFHIRNSLSPELAYMRMAVLPSLLEKVHPNHKAGFDTFMLYEIGKVHNKAELEADMPTERNVLASVVSSGKDKASPTDGAAYFQAKHFAQYLFKQWGLDVTYQNSGDFKSKSPWYQSLQGLFNSNRSAVMLVNDKPIGLIGEFSSMIRSALKLPEWAAGFEVDLNEVLADIKNLSPYKRLSKLPATSKDVTLAVNMSVKFADVNSSLESAIRHPDIDVSIEPLDAFSKDLSKGKNLTFRIHLQPLKKTLDTKTATSIVDTAVAEVEKEFKAKRI